MKQLCLSFASLCCLLASCSITPTKPKGSVYALPMIEQLGSPLSRSLSEALETLRFSRDSYTLSKSQLETLQGKAAAWAEAGQPLVILAAASRDLPPDYARVLSERRAKSVREALIDLGVSPDLMVSTGLGNDAPALFDGDMVAVFPGQRDDAPEPAPSSPTPIVPSLPST